MWIGINKSWEIYKVSLNKENDDQIEVINFPSDIVNELYKYKYVDDNFVENITAEIV